MRSMFVCALLLADVTLGNACASGQFTALGKCCSLCPAGFGVDVPCGKVDTKCIPCPKGTYSSSENLEPCLPCSICPRSVPMLNYCSATSNTQCECDTGFFFFGEYGVCAPCSKCNRGEGVIQECSPHWDTRCQICGPGTFSEEHFSTKPCQTCTRCSDNEVEIQPCLPNSDTLCMDKKLNIMTLPAHDSIDVSQWPVLEGVAEEEDPNGVPGPSRFPPQDQGSSNNIIAYMSVLAAVVLGLIVYVAYKCWKSCKQKKALSKARAAELGTSPEGEKLQSDSGVFLDYHSQQENLHNKGPKSDSKLDNRLYVNLPPQKQEEVERLLQEAGGRGWRHLGTVLGYDPEQLDLFGRGEAPAHTLLSNWAQRDGSTLGLLCSALSRLERPDVVTALNSTSQEVSVV